MVMERRIFHPEIHDLHPGMAERIDDLRALLPASAHSAISWLVVPNWQGQHPVTDNPDLARRLHRMGGTLVLHGWTHSLGRDVLNHLVYGHDNRSEFRSLTPTETADRLERAHAMMLAFTGTSPRWFCAPRWQQTTALAECLRDRQYHGWMDRRSIVLTSGARLAIPALNFDDGARALPQAVGSLMRRGAIRSLLASGQAFRLALHPDDLDRPAILRQIRAVVAALQDQGWQARSLADVTGMS